jgi:hypothetical protein
MGIRILTFTSMRIRALFYSPDTVRIRNTCLFDYESKAHYIIIVNDLLIFEHSFPYDQDPAGYVLNCQYCGSRKFFPDPDFKFYPFLIPDSGSRIPDPDSGSGSRIRYEIGFMSLVCTSLWRTYHHTGRSGSTSCSSPLLVWSGISLPR